MPIDGGVVTGLVAAAAFKYFRDKKKKKKYQEAIRDANNRASNAYSQGYRNANSWASNAYNQGYQNARIDALEAQIAKLKTTQQPIQLVQQDAPPTYVPDPEPPINPEVSRTNDRAERFFTSQVPGFRRMGDGRRGVRVPQQSSQPMPQHRPRDIGERYSRGSREPPPPPPPPPPEQPR